MILGHPQKVVYNFMLFLRLKPQYCLNGLFCVLNSRIFLLDAASGSLPETRQLSHKRLTMHLAKTIGNMHYEMSRKPVAALKLEPKGIFFGCAHKASHFILLTHSLSWGLEIPFL